MGYIAFNSLKYIIFLIICILLYYSVSIKIRWIILLIASIIFYVFAGIKKLPFILLTSFIIWYASKRISGIYTQADAEIIRQELKGKEKVEFFRPYKRQCRNYFLFPALVLVVGMLIYCKFAGTLIEMFQAITGNGELTWQIIVPLGISYYTFSSVGYLLDVYWRKQKPINSYLKFALCVFYFPQIVQGPIVRYNRLIVQFEKENYFDFKNVCFGMQLMIYGYFKKMVIADRLGLFTAEVFGNIPQYQGLVFLIALIFSTFQIYMDFSGCMDIVRGTSQIFGIELDKNFDHPFFSKSIAEFWRRWHCTLGAWFKDYVYLPVATSAQVIRATKKVKEKRGAIVAKTFSTAVPLASVWFLTSIWHGTGWNYMIWGFYYGIIILSSAILEEEYKKIADFFKIDRTTQGYQKFQVVRTFALFTIGRLIVAPGNLNATMEVIRGMFSSFNLWIFWDGTLYQMGLDFKDYMVIFLGLWIVRKVSQLQEKNSVREMIAEKNILIRWIIYYVAIFTVILLGMYGNGYEASAFMYAQF